MGLAVLVTLVMTGEAAGLDRIPLPPLADVERGAYLTRDAQNGATLGRAEWTLRQEIQAGRPILRIDEHGRDALNGPHPMDWSDRTSVDLRGPYAVLRSTRESRDPEGNLLRIEEREFHYDVGSGQLVTIDPQRGRTASRSVRLTGETITPELLPAVLRLLPRIADGQIGFELITREGWRIALRARLAGHERVRVPAGTFECFKVELEPVALVGMLGLRLSPFFMWLTVDPPHFWVKYEGPDGGASRRIVRELVRFETTTAPAAALTRGPGTPPATLIASFGAAGDFRGGRTEFGRSLGLLAILAAIVFQVGVEAALLVSSSRRRRRVAVSCDPREPSVVGHAPRTESEIGGNRRWT
jgi:hypothetical protein